MFPNLSKTCVRHNALFPPCFETDDSRHDSSQPVIVQNDQFVQWRLKGKKQQQQEEEEEEQQEQ